MDKKIRVAAQKAPEHLTLALPPEAGLLLAFRSQLLHEVAPVRSGDRFAPAIAGEFIQATPSTMANDPSIMAPG